jgi:hypothetical protein
MRTRHLLTVLTTAGVSGVVAGDRCRIRKEVPGMSMLSPRMRLTLVSLGALLVAALMGYAGWGP